MRLYGRQPSTSVVHWPHVTNCATTGHLIPSFSLSAISQTGQWNQSIKMIFNVWSKKNSRVGQFSLPHVTKEKFRSGVSISRPGDLDLLPWNWCALLLVRWTTFVPILVFLGRFVLDLSANTYQTRHVTLRPWPLTSEVTALVADAGLRSPSVYQFWSS